MLLAYMKLSFRELMAFRLSFLLEILMRLLDTGIFLLFWWVILSSAPELSGWTVYDILLLIGLAEIYMSVFVLFFLGFYMLPIHVVTGKLDDFMLLPQNLITSLLGDQLQVSRFSRLVVALIITIVGLVLHPQLTTSLMLMGLAVALVALFLNNFILASFNLLSFWIGTMGYIMDIISISDDGLYFPLDRIKGLTRGFFTYFLPIYFVSTFPVALMTEKIEETAIITGILTLSALSVGWIMLFGTVWKIGLRSYQSAGGL